MAFMAHPLPDSGWCDPSAKRSRPVMRSGPLQLHPFSIQPKFYVARFSSGACRLLRCTNNVRTKAK
jgi:hypothetical protein